MNFVALKMLFGDRAKYLMLLAGLTFSTMLIVQQGSIFWGLMTWTQSGITNINAPVWVTDPNLVLKSDAGGGGHAHPHPH